MTRIVITGVDERILELIPAIRAQHHACTARHLAAAMKVHHTHISGRLRIMQAQGLIGFTDMPGSVHVTGTVETINGQTPDVPADSVATPAATPHVVKLGIDPAKIEARRAADAEAAAKTTTAPAAKKAAGAVKKPAVKRR